MPNQLISILAIIQFFSSHVLLTIAIDIGFEGKAELLGMDWHGLSDRGFGKGADLT